MISYHPATDFMPMEAKRVILKIRMLGMIKHEGEIYSYALVKKFTDTGFAAFYGPTLKNDVYNAMRVLEKTGYIRMHSKVEKGKVKNYYAVTARGDRIMKGVGKMMLATVKEANKLFG